MLQLWQKVCTCTSWKYVQKAMYCLTGFQHNVCPYTLWMYVQKAMFVLLVFHTMSAHTHCGTMYKRPCMANWFSTQCLPIHIVEICTKGHVWLTGFPQKVFVYTKVCKLLPKVCVDKCITKPEGFSVDNSWTYWRQSQVLKIEGS